MSEQETPKPAIRCKVKGCDQTFVTQYGAGRPYDAFWEHFNNQHGPLVADETETKVETSIESSIQF